MTTVYILSSIAVMALVTYLIRAVPMILFRRRIKSVWIQSFLYYVPYVVLSAMTFPAVFYSTGSFMSAFAGCAIALVLAYFKKSLLVVAVFAALAAYVVQIIGF